MNYYVSVFKDATIQAVHKYQEGEGDTPGTVKQGIFTIHGQEFRAMDSGGPHDFTFTPAISLFVNCETQGEVDALWDMLSAGGRKDQCGWLQDKFGVSWQIIPTTLGKYLGDKDPKKSGNVMKAMLQMKKIVIKDLEEAYAEA